MEFILKELNMNMGKEEYEMFQDIPLKESGSTNLCNGLPYEVFKDYLESQIARKYQNISIYDTPTTTYIMYVDNVPVGLIYLRTQIDDKWKKWSGNFYYVIRLSQRKKGYGNKILELAIKEFKKMGFKEIYCNSSSGNIASAKVIENNGGIFQEEIEGSRYYKIDLDIPKNIEMFDYYDQDNNFKNILKNQIREIKWQGAQYIYDLIDKNTIDKDLYIMYDKDKNHIISFCGVTDFDEIDIDLKPWLICLYTFRQYRGFRLSKQLIDYILDILRKRHIEYVYLSTDNKGMYEKYGFELLDIMKTKKGRDTQVFRYKL